MYLYFFITILVLALLAWVIFRKRGGGVAIPGLKLDRADQKLLDQHINFYHKLGRRQRKRFEGMVADFFQYVNIEGVGMEVTAADKIMVAASAIIPIFGLGNWRYNNLTNVILYPDTFDSEYQFEGGSRNIMGMVGTGYMNGQMLLSRAALVKGFSPMSGRENVAIHEFVHLLDKSDGATDGVPELLLQHEYAAPWLSLMHKEMHRIKEGHSDINPYALTSEAEFLAVAAEYFFEKPQEFKQKHPELHAQLGLIFKQ